MQQPEHEPPLHRPTTEPGAEAGKPQAPQEEGDASHHGDDGRHSAVSLSPAWLHSRVTYQLRMFTARAATNATVSSEASDWTSMSILAHCVRGMVSVGLKAVEFVAETYT
jgi:hypothetical protein